MKIIERDMLHICGYAAETDLLHNKEDLSALFKFFFDNNKELVLRNLPGSKKGLYGLNWYTQGHEKYCYLLGVEVGAECEPPVDSILISIPKTKYAVSDYPCEKDVIDAWTEFFYRDIPKEGYAPNEQINRYFEFFPESVEGDYELWAPVVKAKA